MAGRGVPGAARPDRPPPALALALAALDLLRRAVDLLAARDKRKWSRAGREGGSWPRGPAPSPPEEARSAAEIPAAWSRRGNRLRIHPQPSALPEDLTEEQLGSDCILAASWAVTGQPCLSWQPRPPHDTMAQDLSKKELLRLEVEQLRKEVKNLRAPVSRTGKEIKDYVEAQAGRDPLLRGVPEDRNPFKEKGGCLRS